MRHIQTFFEKIFCGAAFIISDELGGNMKAPILLVYIITTFFLFINLLCINFLASYYFLSVYNILKEIDYINEISIFILLSIQYLFTLNKYSYSEILSSYQEKKKENKILFSILYDYYICNIDNNFLDNIDNKLSIKYLPIFPDGYFYLYEST